MSNPTTGRGSSVSQHLCAAKKVLQDAVIDAKIATSLDVTEFDTLEREVFEVLRLIRSWRNTHSPISKIPSEILALVPDFLDLEDGDEDLIALTHVCQTWREAFLSRSSLWTHFECEDEEKTRIYLERSKSSPIDLSLYRWKGISSEDPFLQVIPHATGRLRYLNVEGTSECIPMITSHLSHPAPVLEHLSIRVIYGGMLASDPTLTSLLFNGDLTSLRTLCLKYVITELPWRNMINLTKFTLFRTPPATVSVRRLLDFFESAPHLQEVTLNFEIPTTDVQNGRLVLLACLKIMEIMGGPPCVLLDHLLIPVGAKLTTQADLVSSLIGEHLPRSLDNLKNLSNFTTIQLQFAGYCPHMELTGPNGKVSAILKTSRAGSTDLVLKSLAQLDTSKVERLKIDRGEPPPGELLCQTLLSMVDLRTLTLSRCTSPCTFIRPLQPGTSSSEAIICPKLEELVLVLDEVFEISGVVEMAAARVSRGKKLRTVRIVDKGRKDDDISELRKHVWNVEYDWGR